MLIEKIESFSKEDRKTVAVGDLAKLDHVRGFVLCPPKCASTTLTAWLRLLFGSQEEECLHIHASDNMRAIPAVNMAFRQTGQLLTVADIVAHRRSVRPNAPPVVWAFSYREPMSRIASTISQGMVHTWGAPFHNIHSVEEFRTALEEYGPLFLKFAHRSIADGCDQFGFEDIESVFQTYDKTLMLGTMRKSDIIVLITTVEALHENTQMVERAFCDTMDIAPRFVKPMFSLNVQKHKVGPSQRARKLFQAAVTRDMVDKWYDADMPFLTRFYTEERIAAMRENSLNQCAR